MFYVNENQEDFKKTLSLLSKELLEAKEIKDVGTSSRTLSFNNGNFYVLDMLHKTKLTRKQCLELLKQETSLRLEGKENAKFLSDIIEGWTYKYE